ncbi:PAS domain S-box protein [Lacibacterium aquatile]|uniref:histidine kinase n=1 Tax=Lacibacterium aquatile TaxID=1168082 RepID=A0ABW5DUB7_9PROT
MQQNNWLANHLKAVVDSSNDAIISKTMQGIVTSWNRGAEHIFGYTAEEMIGRPITQVIPPDRWSEETEILSRISRGERIEHYNTIRLHKDGRLLDISLTISPIKADDGTIVGASKIARDITAQRLAQQKQGMLLHEMSHRVKNLFSLTTGLITLCDQSAESASELRDLLTRRLSSLARAHDMVLPIKTGQEETPGHAADFAAVVEKVLEPYREESSDQRIRIQGPPLAIGPLAVTDTALLLQEFATNAMKYGALTNRDGSIAVSWSVDDQQLHLLWQERGGPTIGNPPDRKGFGSLLADGTVNGRLGGRLERIWEQEGLTIRLAVPLKTLTS